MSSTVRSEPFVQKAGIPLPVEIRGIRGARRLRLRFDEKRGVLKLTGPLRMNRNAALDWVLEQREWVEAQLASSLAPEPFIPGAIIPLEGDEIRLEWNFSAARSPRLASGVLVVGGPIEGFARRVEIFLKRRALDILSRETKDVAEGCGATLRAVSVGDADTRWGSCSSSGRIRYSWRLILAPPEVRRYVVAHEVAHLVHMNHGPQFKALERELFDGDPETPRLLLRRIGNRLKRIGRTG